MIKGINTSTFPEIFFDGLKEAGIGIEDAIISSYGKKPESIHELGRALHMTLEQMDESVLVDPYGKKFKLNEILTLIDTIYIINIFYNFILKTE